MKRNLGWIGLCVCVMSIVSMLIFPSSSSDEKDSAIQKSIHKKMLPSLADAWKWSYPEQVWDANEASRKWNVMDRWLHDESSSSTKRQIEGEWRIEGPSNIGGRFNFIRQHPTEPFQFYAGSSAGGLWMTPGDDEWICP
jgi:hypothetical protein